MKGRVLDGLGPTLQRVRGLQTATTLLRSAICSRGFAVLERDASKDLSLAGSARKIGYDADVQAQGSGPLAKHDLASCSSSGHSIKR
jgi:hypothetical protein